MTAQDSFVLNVLFFCWRQDDDGEDSPNLQQQQPAASSQQHQPPNVQFKGEKKFQERVRDLFFSQLTTRCFADFADMPTPYKSVRLMVVGGGARVRPHWHLKAKMKTSDEGGLRGKMTFIDTNNPGHSVGGGGRKVTSRTAKLKTTTMFRNNICQVCCWSVFTVFRAQISFSGLQIDPYILCVYTQE